MLKIDPSLSILWTFEATTAHAPHCCIGTFYTLVFKIWFLFGFSFVCVFCVLPFDVSGYWEALPYVLFTFCRWVALFFSVLALVIDWADASHLGTRFENALIACTNVGALRSAAICFPITRPLPHPQNHLSTVSRFLLSGVLTLHRYFCLSGFGSVTRPAWLYSLATLVVTFLPRRFNIS